MSFHSLEAALQNKLFTADWPDCKWHTGYNGPVVSPQLNIQQLCPPTIYVTPCMFEFQNIKTFISEKQNCCMFILFPIRIVLFFLNYFILRWNFFHIKKRRIVCIWWASTKRDFLFKFIFFHLILKAPPLLHRIEFGNFLTPSSFACVLK